MTEPKRLRETHGSRLEGLLLAAVRGEVPPPSARARTLRAVAAGIAAGGAVATTASTASSAIHGTKEGILFIAGKWLAVGAGAGALVTGSLVGPLHHLVEPHSAGSTESAARAGPAAPARRTPAPDSDLANSGGYQAASQVAAPSDVASLAKPSSPAKAPDAQHARPAAAPLAAEVAAIDRAARAVAEHDPARALAALDAYEKAFAGGVLRPEATVLRVRALVLQGDGAQAASIARAFLARNPHSPHADRLRSLVEIDPER